ncbi:MAG: hypothetical protein C4B59_10075 [Candidatus Methanogaster sp.]|uniref:Uncharacterized protein n=1 Tax=Candidatus Methanogaster sp. TaxID=3386292 RepID=A0AC61L1H9_9EURY|nr:MAG: hypothetical protein C4B59_10075 [ANME-2 cluster archaeon]
MKAERSVEHWSISRKLLALLFVGLFFLSVVPIVSADLGWSYRKAITIDHTKVNSTLIDFPVLVSITDTGLKNHAQNDGDDILFVNADNTIKLDHEIEYFDGSTGELQAWVMIPSLSSSDDTIIHMYYGNPISGNQQNATGVWDYNYTMIQHLEERPDNDEEGHYDSTSNGNSATPKNFGDFTGSATYGTGKIGGADEFDGTNDYIDFDATVRDELSPTDAVSVEVWIKTNSVSEQKHIVDRIETGDGYGLFLDSSGHVRASINGGFGTATSSKEVDDNHWHHVVFTYDKDAGGTDEIKVYVDGVHDGTGDFSIAMDYYPEPRSAIGIRTDIMRSAFRGTIDEVRISDTARSGDWINTSFNNQNDPSRFYSVGHEVEEDFIPATDTDGDGVPDVWDMDNSTSTGYWTDPQGIGRMWGDMNGDGKLTSVDALMILQAAVGKISL